MNQSIQAAKLAFAVASIAIATFCAMDVLMKGLAIELGAYNTMLWRTLISLALASLLFICKRPVWPDVSAIRLHVWRGLVTSVMAFLFFWGLIYVPIAEAIGLSFIAPLIALYLAAVLLNEKIGKQAIFASVIGLIGALVTVGGRLSGEYDAEMGQGIAAILLSALLYAYNLILQRQQALIAGPVEIAFFQNCTLVVVYVSVAPLWAVVPSITFLPNLVAAAMLGIVSLLMMSWAYARAEASTLIPVEYTAFIWGALFGWLVFNEVVTVTTIIGTALIVVGCLVAAWQQPGRVDHIESTVA
jgi:S-adenosylmethionine uptake transporter